VRGRWPRAPARGRRGRDAPTFASTRAVAPSGHTLARADSSPSRGRTGAHG
jgi:hypothetical protein